MVKRNVGIDFAGGALVFPGGKVDVSDTSSEFVKHCDGISNLTRQQISDRVCGIRESFEEGGILLARHLSSGKIVNGEFSKKLGVLYRKKVHDRKINIWQMVEKEKLKLACDCLVPFAHWITPKVSPKRFDTMFFLARSPDGQVGIHDQYETVDSIWINPDSAIKAFERKKYKIVFATRMNLKKLSQFGSVSAALRESENDKIMTVEPIVTREGDVVTYSIPIEAGYGIEHEIQLN